MIYNAASTTWARQEPVQNYLKVGHESGHSPFHISLFLFHCADTPPIRAVHNTSSLGEVDSALELVGSEMPPVRY
jgi:hypothetical protein